MKRLGLIVAVAVGIGVALGVTSKRPDHITLSAGSASQMGTNGMFMATLDISNDGPADRLLSVSSPEAPGIRLVNPAGHDAALVVPGKGKAQLAMDGAHMMLRADPAAFPAGAFLPVALTFEHAGEVVARLQNTGPSSMRHGAADGVSEAPAPSVKLDWVTPPGPEGGTMRLNIENLEVASVPDGTPHVPGEGHAHAYLNGLKLGRLYEETFEIGALLPGDYRLTVSVNTHDHRPYLVEGAPVQAVLEFSIP